MHASAISRLRQAMTASAAPPRQGACALALLLAAALPLAGCDSTIIKHGTQFHDGDLQQIQPGMSQEQVRMNLGTPATTAVVGTGPSLLLHLQHADPDRILPAQRRRTARSWRSTSRRAAPSSRSPTTASGRQGVRLRLAHHAGAGRPRRQHRAPALPQSRHAADLRRIDLCRRRSWPQPQPRPAPPTAPAPPAAAAPRCW